MSDPTTAEPPTKRHEDAAPDFVAQTAEPMTAGERYKWFQVRAEEFRTEGAEWIQMSVDDTLEPLVLLIEGWRNRPMVQPPPHFLMTADKDI